MNISDNLYTILQVPKDATYEDIKRAYRKLALKYHPDKCGNVHIEKFNKINSAYQILSDTDKRKKYDMMSKEETYDVIFQQLFSMVFNSLFRKTENIKNLTIEVPIDMSEIYHKAVRKITLKVRRYDSHYKETYESIPIYLSLLNYEKQYVYKGLGDEYLEDDKIVKTDIILILKVKEHPCISIDSILSQYDLYIEKEITLYQYYYGYEEVIDYFGSPLTIKHDGKHNTIQFTRVEKGMGFPFYDHKESIERHGDLYIYFSVKLPSQVHQDNPEFKRFLKEFFD